MNDQSFLQPQSLKQMLPTLQNNRQETMIIKRMKQYGYDVARKDLLRKRQLPTNMLVQILLGMFFLMALMSKVILAMELAKAI